MRFPAITQLVQKSLERLPTKIYEHAELNRIKKFGKCFQVNMYIILKNHKT